MPEIEPRTAQDDPVPVPLSSFAPVITLAPWIMIGGYIGFYYHGEILGGGYMTGLLPVGITGFFPNIGKGSTIALIIISYALTLTSLLKTMSSRNMKVKLAWLAVFTILLLVNAIGFDKFWVPSP